jgi:hypothetical protein
MVIEPGTGHYRDDEWPVRRTSTLAAATVEHHGKEVLRRPRGHFLGAGTGFFERESEP